MTARHLADLGAVDVPADDSPVLAVVTNSGGDDADVPADTYNIQVRVACDRATLTFDSDVALAEGVNTIAYTFGSVEGGSYARPLEIGPR